MWLFLFALSSFTDALPKRNPMDRPRPPKVDLNEQIIFYSDTPTGPLELDFIRFSHERIFNSIKLKVIDCIENKYYCEDHGATVFPTVKYQSKTKTSNFTWEFTVPDLYEFSVKMAKPSSLALANTEIQKKFNSHQSSFALFFNPELKGISDISYVESFRKIAENYKHTHVYFATCHAGEIADSEGVDRGMLPILLQLGGDSAYRYNISRPMTIERMESFIETHKCTMRLRVNKSYYQEALQCFEGKVVGISFFRKSSELGKHNPAHVNMFVKELREKDDFRFQFASVDLDLYPELFKEFEVSEPEFIVMDYRDSGKIVSRFSDFDLRNYANLRNLLEKVWKKEDVSGKNSCDGEVQEKCLGS